MSTVALCIPAYNAAAYLPQLLKSINKQSIPFDDVLIYNDCSTDNTVEIARDFNIKVINGDINRGCSYGKNQLAKITQCDWVHFHDADDDILPNFTEKIHDWIKNHGLSYDVLILNFNYIDHVTGKFLGKGNHNKLQLNTDPLKYAISNKIVNFGVYNRQAMLNAGGFDLDENVLYNEDNAYHQRLAKAGLKFDYLEEITCINYRYQKSMSASNALKCARAHFHVLEKTYQDYSYTYPREISDQLWKNVAILAAYDDWEYVKKSVKLIKCLKKSIPDTEDPIFRLIANFNPWFAIKFRETFIRLFKSELRNNQN